MLWAGIPVLTAIGDTFPTRVAASLVTAAGVPELVAPTRENYVAAAIALGRDRRRSRAIHDKLRAARATAPYFSTERLVRGLEATYDAMYAGKMRAPAGL
jgi:predicted O-linked N-acetylglucosamine transferase (SPINDLY family)